ncbi:MAG: hypothetical protein ACKO83_13470, partial [Roseiflexaceae bacterium]
MRTIILLLSVTCLGSCTQPQASMPAKPTAPPTRTQLPAPTAQRPTTTPVETAPAQATASTVVQSTSSVQISQMTPDQLRCVAIQIGKERVPKIQQGDTASSDETAVIEACFKDANAHMLQINPSAVANQGHSVLADETWLSTSLDGKTWQTPVLLDTAASVPEILALPDGSLLAMWCSFKDKPARFQEKLAVAR